MPSFVYLGLIILAMGGAGAWYYNSTQAKIETLTAYNAQLTANVEQMEAVNKTNQATINQMKADFERQRVQFEEAQASLNEIRAQNNQLKDRLGKHDIGALAAAKPALVERVLNGASNKVMRCFEIESGAPLTDEERYATSAKAFNSECPWIFDDLVARGVLIDPDATTTSESNN